MPEYPVSHPTDDPDPIDHAEADPLSQMPEVLSDVMAWRLAPARWGEVERLLDVLAAMAQAGDEPELRRCLVEIQMLGPVRITRLGATPATPAPPEVRERVNHLIHTLRGAPPTGSPAPQDNRDETEEERR